MQRAKRIAQCCSGASACLNPAALSPLPTRLSFLRSLGSLFLSLAGWHGAVLLFLASQCRTEKAPSHLGPLSLVHTHPWTGPISDFSLSSFCVLLTFNGSWNWRCCGEQGASRSFGDRIWLVELPSPSSDFPVFFTVACPLWWPLSSQYVSCHPLHHLWPEVKKWACIIPSISAYLGFLGSKNCSKALDIIDK